MRRYSEAVKADVRRRMSPLQRQCEADIRGAWQSRDHPLQVAQVLAASGGGGAGLTEGTRGLGRCCQVRGGAGDCWPERH